MPEYAQCYTAVYLMLESDGKILMLRRFDTGYKDGEYSFIAGHVDDNEEDVFDAMIREASEEADITLSRNDLEVVHVMHRYKNRIDIFFKCNKWNGTLQNKESNKCDDMQWFEIDKIPENTIDYVKYMMKECSNGNTFSTFGFPK